MGRRSKVRFLTSVRCFAVPPVLRPMEIVVKSAGKKSRAGCGSDKLSVQVNLYEISAFPRQCNLLPLSAFT